MEMTRNLKITEKQILEIKLMEIGRKIEEVQADPEEFTIEYMDRLDAERIGLINEYFRRFHDRKIVHIDSRRLKTGRI